MFMQWGLWHIFVLRLIENKSVELPLNVSQSEISRMRKKYVVELYEWKFSYGN